MRTRVGSSAIIGEQGRVMGRGEIVPRARRQPTSHNAAQRPMAIVEPQCLGLPRTCPSVTQKWPREVAAMTNEELLQAVDWIKTMMIAVATGGPSHKRGAIGVCIKIRSSGGGT